MIAFVGLLVLAPPSSAASAPADTAVIARDLSVPQLDALEASCAERFACASRERTAHAVADAASLGISCVDEDVTCWHRFLAAEGFTRVLVAAPRGTQTTVALIEGEAAPRFGAGPDAREALAAIFAPAAANPTDARPELVPLSSPPRGAVAEEAPAVRVPLVVAGAAGAVSLVSAALATVVSVGLNHDLDAAGRGEAELRAYDERAALFFALAGAGTLAGATAIGAVVWVVVTE